VAEDETSYGLQRAHEAWTAAGRPLAEEG
jgi:hypothetical protein